MAFTDRAMGRLLIVVPTPSLAFSQGVVDAHEPVSVQTFRSANGCTEAVNWPDHIKVAVNLSPAQLNNRNLLCMVKDALANSSMSASKPQLEITESVLLQNTLAALATL